MVSDRIPPHDGPVDPSDRQNPPSLDDLIDDLQSAIDAADGAAFEAALRELGGALGPAGPRESAAVGPRLAELLPQAPPFPRAHLAMMVGACVERGADPLRCADQVLAGVRGALTGALLLAERWEQTGGGDLPNPEQESPAEAHERIEDPEVLDEWHAHQAVAGWWTLELWEMAALAVYSHAAVRTAARASGVTEVLLELAGRFAEVSHELKCLCYAARTLDDEPLLVLHRESGTGYLLRMDGLTDTFQLHTLLAEVLIGGGHLPGTAPHPEIVALARTELLPPDHRPTATGHFNLVGPDGTWFWNEGTPDDIPEVDGVRTVILDPPPYDRSWTAGRFIQQIPGDLRLERVLDPAEAAARLTAAAPTVGFG